MKTRHIITNTTEFDKNEVGELDYIETIYAVNDGMRYAANTFTSELETDEYREQISKFISDNCTTIEVYVYKNENGDLVYLHKPY